MNESAMSKVLTQYVIENANLKLQIEQLKEEKAELEKVEEDTEKEKE